MLEWLPVLSVLVFFGLLGYLAGKSRGAEGMGLLLGLLLGPIGCLLVFLVKDRRRRCPLCKGVIPEGRISRCKNCGGELVKRPAPGAPADPMEAWEAEQAQQERVRQGLKVPSGFRPGGDD